MVPSSNTGANSICLSFLKGKNKIDLNTKTAACQPVKFANIHAKDDIPAIGFRVLMM
jgi:hypothetical protein